MKTIATPLIIASVLLVAQILPTPDWALVVLLVPAVAILIWWSWQQWKALSSEEDALNQRIQESNSTFAAEESTPEVEAMPTTESIPEAKLAEPPAPATELLVSDSENPQLDEEPDPNFTLGNNWR